MLHKSVSERILEATAVQRHTQPLPYRVDRCRRRGTGVQQGCRLALGAFPFGIGDALPRYADGNGKETGVTRLGWTPAQTNWLGKL